MGKFKLIISTLASEDIDSAISWYSEQKPGLENRFLAELREFYKQMLINPERYGFYAVAYEIRKARLNKFPYYILYQIQKDVVYVTGIIHKARSDEFVKDRYL